MADSSRKGCLRPFLIGVVVLTITSMAVFYYFLRTDLYRPVAPSFGTLVIEHAAIWQGGDSTFLQRVVIEGQQIVCVGTDCQVPEGAETLDAGGKLLLPGLIDLGVTFYANSAENQDLGILDQIMDISRQRPLVRRHMHDWGITSFKSSGDPDENILLLARQILAGEIEGPRVFPSGRVFTAKGGHPVGTLMANDETASEAFAYQVSDINSARQVVKEMMDNGLSGITMVLDDIEGHVPKLTPEQVRALIEQVHKAKGWACVRIGTSADMRTAANAGADMIEYMPRDELDSVTLATLIETKPLLIPLLIAGDKLETKPLGDERKGAAEKAAMLYRAGLQIGVGSMVGEEDSYGKLFHAEFAALVQAGVPTAHLLESATVYGAVPLKADDVLGKIAPGYEANLIMVAEKPWENLSVLDRPSWVMQQGRIVVPHPEK